MMNRLLHKLVNTEIPDIDSRWSWLERSFLVGFIIVFTITFILNYPGIFLGFGLGDEFEPSVIWGFFEQLKNDNVYLFYAGLALLIFNILFRMQVFLRGQLAYPSNDPRLPMKTIALFVGANSLNIVFVFVTVSILGLITHLLDLNFALGFGAVSGLFNLAIETANNIPTLIELPLLVAFALVYTVQGFFHYWIHRLCHLNRFLWLVLHRFHHMPPVLTTATTTVVITSIPFFLGLVFVKTFIFATISKLIFHRPMFMEIFFLHTVMWIGEAYSHQTALYAEGARSRFIRWISFFAGTGIHHYLHHSRDKEIVTSNTTNQVNIGGGFFFTWDIIFGTFKDLPAAEKGTPKVGLWGNPDLTHNPLRLVLSGLMQIAYELWHNKGLIAKLKVLVGSVSYQPEITKNFHLSNKIETSTSIAELDTSKPLIKEQSLV